MAELTLNSCLNQRKQLKSSLTRFHNYVTNFDHTKDITELKARLQRGESLLTDFELNLRELGGLEVDKDYSEELEEFEDKYFRIISTARNIIESRAESNVSSTGNSQTHSTSQSNKLIKLPTMNLPLFDGRYDCWMNFYDIFEALVNKNDTLTNIQRFFYLKSSLKGEAAHLLSSLEVTDSNYAIAWGLLKERYENKKLIINTHVKGIFELPQIVKESHKALRSLIDNFNKNVRSLHNLKLPTDQWDVLLIYIITNKLDSNTKHEWEKSSVNNPELPTLDELLKFLLSRCQILENLNDKIQQGKPYLPKPSYPMSHVAINNTIASSCYYCKENHYLYQCPNFLKLTIQNRWNEVKRLKLCVNCFRGNHYNNECKSASCKKCDRKHNTLLHNNSFEQPRDEGNQLIKASSSHQKNNMDTQNEVQTHLSMIPSPIENTKLVAHSFINEPNAILSTAQIHILGANGNIIKCRALLDSGSQANFITQELFEKLTLKGSKIDIPIAGISKSITRLSKQVTTQIRSIFNDFNQNLTFLVLRDITGNVPSKDIDISDIEIPRGINLADQNFHLSSKIDVLLGAGVFWSLLSIGQIKIYDKNVIFQKTRLGWIFGGTVANSNHDIKVLHSMNRDVQDQLERFWKVEECSYTRKLSKDELYCEEHFLTNFKRDESGRCEVRLPMTEENFDFKNSIDNAIHRLNSLEKRFNRDPEFKRQYQAFMTEYESLGHMTEITPVTQQGSIFYLPHHGVLKQSSVTTKLRVVFDGSCKSSAGASLNDKLFGGPHIQDDLLSIVLRFRKHNVILVADIAKMYRQINVTSDQRDMQRIIWRNNPTEPLRHYRLNTLTYGTSPASFLATRCLRQIGIEQTQHFPEASHAITNDFYMDDLITGTYTIGDAIKLKKDISAILRAAGFELRQWSSNERAIFNDSDVESEVENYYISDDKNIKTLGLMWDTKSDTLIYSLNFKYDEKKITKRTILSVISKIFDPLGLISPVTIKAKCILQRLWQEQLNWDESVPLYIYTEWKQVIFNLKNIETISLPRQVTIKNYISLELHGFCDASEAAYGCCIYVRSKDVFGNTQSNLLCSKSRVAPLKTLTMPRLELCGALLLSQLMQKVIISFNSNFENIYYWCDSTIAIAWIRSEPIRFQIFVANRIADIQKLTKPTQWRHVRSEDNPADLVSRGVSAEHLSKNKLWWEGPKWLHNDSYSLTEDTIHLIDLPETRKQPLVGSLIATTTNEFEILHKYSCIQKLKRVMAYILRFVNNITVNRLDRKKGELTLLELEIAMRKLILLVQSHHFKLELESLRSCKPVSKNSKVLSLNPFLDKYGIIRVGGRLSRSSFSVDQKHPIILPAKSDFTNLIIDFEHKNNMHIGVEGTLGIVRRQFWPIHGRSTTRRVVHKCVKCARFRKQTLYPIMGDLPSERIHPSRPFLYTAVDYAGPLLIKDGKTRNRKILKAYLCVFVCFSTKAIHLELAGDLSTSSFLNAFKRFVGRRGICSTLYSDNGTNFVGANKELKNVIKLLSNSEFSEYFRQNSIDWKFMPPHSPHFGGLHEAAVKSAKTIMKRVIGNSHLTYEQLATVFVQIEAVLNSRPITPLSEDPNDLTALTPGHFLIGDVLRCVPQEDNTHIPVNRLTHYTLLNQMFQQFWSRWKTEYIHTLQARKKWVNATPDIKIGTMVLLKNATTPPLLWPLGFRKNSETASRSRQHYPSGHS
ncbi:uncharacterized protein LOC116164038 [Photinus pyralis]|uniref:uncharacterized protein LOC116164038 n=1 Tax=Photinus pyralis TaxID=7054 RepID=UPI0012677CB1|nr:uncharacterized protein LOC116164038 [Photinus pyralis]